MNAVVHVIATIGVNHINVIRVTPRNRPGINETERVAAVSETAMIVIASVYVETVAAAKAGGVARVGNPAMRVAAIVSA